MGGCQLQSSCVWLLSFIVQKCRLLLTLCACEAVHECCVVRSLLIGLFLGVRLGSSDACQRRGVWEPSGQWAGGWGQGKKDEVNVLEPNNQHVDVFIGWPISTGAAGSSRSPGLRGPQEHNTITSDDGWTAPLQITWNQPMVQNRGRQLAASEPFASVVL